MRIKLVSGVAALGVAATLAAVLPLQSPGTKQDTITQVAQQRDIQPEYATTANTTIRLKSYLTEEQIEQARKRVKADKPLEKPKQTNERPKGLEPESSEKLTLGDAYKQAGQRIKEAKKHPYKDFGRDAQAATTSGGDKVNLSLAAAGDLNESTVGYPVGTTPPAELEVSCFSGTAEFDVVIDRFSSCSRMKVIVDYYRIYTDRPPEYMGKTTGTLKLFNQQYNTARSTRMFAKMQKDSVTYDWGLLDNIWTAPGIDLTTVGNCVSTGTGCSATRSPITLTWENWNSIDTWYYWDGHSNETQGLGRDKQLAHQTHVQVYTDTGEYKTINKGSFAKRINRCDSANYIYAGWEKGCVFLETIPKLMYSRADYSPQKDVAEHIYKAQNTPDSTYPTKSTGKNIPGKYTADPFTPGLHRLHANFHLTQMDANTAHKDAACHSTGEYSTTGIPLLLRPDTANGEECDEYPFRATLEGAASPDWDFSVQAVNGTQNGSAGQMLMIYLRNHRILAWDSTIPADYNDRYYVQIIDF